MKPIEFGVISVQRGHIRSPSAVVKKNQFKNKNKNKNIY